MNSLNDKMRMKKEAEAAEAAKLEHADSAAVAPDQALESVEDRVGGKVSELVKESAGEDIQTSVGGRDDGQVKQVQNDEMKDDRAALKEKLLKNAPKEAVMRAEVKKVLVRKKEKLESKVKKYKRKRNYHLLSLAVMQLRLVVHQLEEVAKAGYDTLKEVWLKVVHRFA